jgi:hypothetical protein
VLPISDGKKTNDEPSSNDYPESVCPVAEGRIEPTILARRLPWEQPGGENCGRHPEVRTPVGVGVSAHGRSIAR